MEPPRTTPFWNSKRIDWGTYKLTLSDRVTISKKHIKSIVGIKKITQMITSIIREAFAEEGQNNMMKLRFGKTKDNEKGRLN